MFKMYIVPDIKVCYNNAIMGGVNKIKFAPLGGEKMPASKAQQKAVSKYMKANYDEIKVRVNKGTKQALQEAAKDKGESINGYIKSAVQARYEADTGKEIDL